MYLIYSEKIVIYAGIVSRVSVFQKDEQYR